MTGNWSEIPKEEITCSFCKQSGYNGYCRVSEAHKAMKKYVIFRFCNDTVPLCVDCQVKMVKRCGRWECDNSDCSVISVDWRGTHRDSTVKKEVLVES